jgi:dienelactone hydrolase
MAPRKKRHRRIRPPHRCLRAVGTLVTLISISSCATRTHVAYDAATARVDPAADAATRPDPRFVYESEPIDADNQLTAEGARYEIRRLRFPSIGSNGQPGDLVTVDYHRSRLPGAHPVVIVLPIWGRQVYPSNAVTRTLRKRSNGTVHILNVMGESFLIDWPALGAAADETQFIELWADGAQNEINTVIDTRRLIDWAVNQPEIDGDHIGLIGFSHGAMLAPTIAIQDPRITALVLVMGGAHPQTVIAQCRGARTEGVQIWAEERFGWSRTEMEERLEPLYDPLDPARYPDRVDPEQVLIIEAGKDECVPRSCRDDLWEAMGRPERTIINATHRHAFYTMTPLNLNWMRKRIWDFLESRLLESPTHSNSDRQ